MNKSELIAAVAETSKQPKTVVEKVLDAICDETANALRRGEDVKVLGFGKYQVKVRAERTARNPRTGEPIKVAESKVVKFTPADAVTSHINRR